jgi:very-short-patch-repair endonuclease
MRGADARRTDRSRSLRRDQTDVERKLWNRLNNRQIAGCKFVREEPIGPYFADFACRERKLVVELDGSQHAENPRDMVRDAYLTAQGYRVLRFWNGDVNAALTSVLDTIYAALEESPSPREQIPPPAGGERSSRRQPTG